MSFPDRIPPPPDDAPEAERLAWARKVLAPYRESTWTFLDPTDSDSEIHLEDPHGQ